MKIGTKVVKPRKKFTYPVPTTWKNAKTNEVKNNNTGSITIASKNEKGFSAVDSRYKKEIKQKKFELNIAN